MSPLINKESVSVVWNESIYESSGIPGNSTHQRQPTICLQIPVPTSLVIAKLQLHQGHKKGRLQFLFSLTQRTEPVPQHTHLTKLRHLKFFHCKHKHEWKSENASLSYSTEDLSVIQQFSKYISGIS